MKREVWQRGPIEGVPPLLQPAAHAILQMQEDVHELAAEFPSDLIWERPGGVASAGFHLQHIPGVLDRLLTYARGEGLSDAQREALASEGRPVASDRPMEALLQRLDAQVEQAIAQLRSTDPSTLLDHRGVGRAQIPSNVIGLLFHAAEHVQRHLGQLLVTMRVVTAQDRPAA